ncbi:MAG TPA: N-acetyl-gamma-glutamyl-phosphate reductase [Gaiellaceae bacterium]|nr:N-acetyl-gamma-glutamyl-phosphate reductase [Gaiellaceae bacterium]
MPTTTAILGASGYAGQELLDRVLVHPELELVALGSDSLAGAPASALDPRLGRSPGRNGDSSLPAFVPNDDALAAGADVVFLCLGHEEAAALTPPGDGIVVDLSGAHRLLDPELYPAWYGFSHPAPDALAAWEYALPELGAPRGRLLANPGCYATAILLALHPLRDAIERDGIAVDAKSGVSGAGRIPRPSSHAGAVLENVAPYRIGRHQHVPEVDRALGFPVCFAPHLLPVRRGLIATCFVRPLPGGDLRGLLDDAYTDSHVVALLPEDVAPELARVQGTDAAELNVFEDVGTGLAVVVCALDNLGKGAAGQAVQNANLALGLEPTAGLRLSGVLV